MRTVEKIVIYGDSISTTDYGGGGYEGFLREKFHAKVQNYAIGGSGLTLATPDNTASILADSGNIPKDADLILVWHGTNDWYWGSPLGELTDKTSDTFLGAVGEAVHRIREGAPEAVLVWLTPVFRFQAPDGRTEAGYAYETENKAGHTMADYYQGLQSASAYHGFPLIDMRVLCGIHETNHPVYLEDGVHPSKAGYERIWRVLERGLKDPLYAAGYISDKGA